MSAHKNIFNFFFKNYNGVLIRKRVNSDER